MYITTIERLFTIVYGLISITLFVKYADNDSYGEWIFLNSLIGFITISDLGLVQVIGNVSMRFSEKEKRFELYYTLIKVLLIVSCVILFIGIGLTFIWLPAYFIVLILYALTTVYGGLMQMIYRSEEKLEFAVTIRSFFKVLMFVCSILIFVISRSFILVASVMLFFGIISTGFLFIRLNENLRFIPPKNTSLKVLQPYLKTSLASSVLPVYNNIYVNGPIWFIDALLGSKILILFNAIRTLYNLPKNFSGIIFSSYSHNITHFHFRNQFRARNVSFLKARKLGSLLLIVAYLFLLLIDEYVFKSWFDLSFEYISVIIPFLILGGLSYFFWNSMISLYLAINITEKILKPLLLLTILPLIIFAISLYVKYDLFVAFLSYSLVEFICTLIFEKTCRAKVNM